MALPVPASTSVLIVGGGPAGLLLAILLRQLDVACVVVEQRDGAQSAPAAHVVSARTLEICRSAGVDMDALETVASAPEEGAWVRWVESLVGPELGRVPFEGQHRFAQLFESSPTPLRNLSQHVFEPVLREQLGDVRDGCQWVSAEEVSGGIVSKLRDTQT
ncbi:MAG: FAD-dependent monooxygenase, partial [Actinomycetota bacterium]